METESIIQGYKEAVCAYFSALENDGEKEIDYTAKQMWSIQEEIESLSQTERLKLSVLFKDEHPGVRLYAARRLQDLMPDAATAVYEDVSRLTGAVGLSAKNALDAIRGIDIFQGPPAIEF